MKLPPGYVPGQGPPLKPSGYGGFGERMLRSMGWEKGQGLGRNNDGIKEAIEVKKKEDTVGVRDGSGAGWRRCGRWPPRTVIGSCAELFSKRSLLNSCLPAPPPTPRISFTPLVRALRPNWGQLLYQLLHPSDARPGCRLAATPAGTGRRSTGRLPTSRSSWARRWAWQHSAAQGSAAQGSAAHHRYSVARQKK